MTNVTQPDILSPASVLYASYEAAHAAAMPFRHMASAAASGLSFLDGFGLGSPFIRFTGTLVEMQERLTRRYPRTGRATGTDAPAAGREETVLDLPFCRLVRFAGQKGGRRPMLLLAPLSGHHATLVRDTADAFREGFDLHVSDWKDARDVPVSAGGFGLSDYADYVRAMLNAIGPGTTLVAVCQPAVPAVMAAAIMAEDGDPCLPASLVLMGGPIDTRLSPTKVNRLAVSKGTGWFEKNMIAAVPSPHAGKGRAVYPGFMQLSAFVSMNAERHLDAHAKLFKEAATGNSREADKIRSFYDEYLAVMDLPAEFYIETVRDVFVEHRLPRGTMTARGRRVDTTRLARLPIMTVEGGRDDITGAGQTHAALDLCGRENAPRLAHTEAEAGHYGIFSGSRFRSSIAPAVMRFAA